MQTIEVNRIIGPAFDPGGKCVGVSLLSESGVPVLLKIAPDSFEHLAHYICQARDIAATGKAATVAQSARTPSSYHTMMSKEIEGLLVVFDLNTPTQTAFALHYKDAAGLCHLLLKSSRELSTALSRIGKH